MTSPRLYPIVTQESTQGVVHSNVGTRAFFVLAGVISLILAPKQVRADEVISQTLPSGGIADIRAIDGTIRVVQGGTAVAVSAHATTVSGSPVDLHVVNKREGNVWLVCTVPLEQASCAEQGHEGVHADGDTRIDLTVALPPNVKLKLDDVSGMIEAQSLANDVDAHSVSGRLSIGASGAVSARTETGDMLVRLGHAFRTVTVDSETGNVVLQVPSGASARIEARTMNGDITAKRAIKLSDNSELVGRDAFATLGLGGSTITIHTISGSITLDTY